MDRQRADRGTRCGTRPRSLIGLAAAALVLAGCTAPRPDVAFYAGTDQVIASPVGWCEGSVATGFSDCTTTRSNLVTITLQRGAPLLVEVPTDIADVPWQVYVEYTDASGQSQNTSTLFTAGRNSLVVRARDPQDQFTYVEVQAIPVPAAGTTGIVYVPTRTWAARVTPAG